MQDTPEPIIDMCTLGPVETNCFIVHVPEGEDPDGCWIIDCGMDPDPMLRRIEERGLQPRGLLLTHCHYDHIGGVEELFGRFGPLPTRVHPIELGWNRDPELNLSAMSGWPCIAPQPEHTYEDGDELDLGGSAWRVLHLPGHSPGSVGLLNARSNCLVAGDTLFAGSIGRVDFPTSDEQAMRRSLARLVELPPETRVLPGHGPGTTIQLERQQNPFLHEWGLV
jgi:hydroxyacylglutathione hydrolase